jgi:hypothetical protein
MMGFSNGVEVHLFFRPCFRFFRPLLYRYIIIHKKQEAKAQIFLYIFLSVMAVNRENQNDDTNACSFDLLDDRGYQEGLLMLNWFV